MAQPEAFARRLTAALLLASCCVAIGCARRASDVTVTWNIEPTPPVADALTLVRFTLRYGDGTPARGARLTLEGHMSHPGMTPVTTAVTERGDGAYDARLHLSMAGDWVLVVAGELADGNRLTRSVEVPSVRPAEAQPQTR